jgi:hypothetical protein
VKNNEKYGSTSSISAFADFFKSNQGRISTDEMMEKFKYFNA